MSLIRFNFLYLIAIGLVITWPIHTNAQSSEKETIESGLVKSSAAKPTLGLTLADVLTLAEQQNPILKSKQAQLIETEGVRTDANALFYNNPQISIDRGRRTVPQEGLPSERQNEWRIGISQPIEIAGQPAYRRKAAEAAHDAVRAEVDSTRDMLRATTAQLFYRILALQQKSELAAQALKLFEETASAIQKRKAAGEDTKLDANVALVEAERANNELALVREQLLDAQMELASQLQLPATQIPQVVGDLSDKLTKAGYSLEQLLGQFENQPRLNALLSKEESARAKLDLERANRSPEVAIGLSQGREGSDQSRERLTSISLSISIPIFRRNAGGVGQAAAGLDQAKTERQAALRDLQSQIRTSWSKLESLRARALRLQTSVLPALLDNEQLSVKSQKVGQIGLIELILVNRQALDAKRDLIDALLDYQTTRLTLELAAGWTQKGVNP